MQLLYSNILPLGIEEDQKTIIDAFHEQLQLADRVEIAVGYTSYASLEELDNLIDAYAIHQVSHHTTLHNNRYYVRAIINLQRHLHIQHTTTMKKSLTEPFYVIMPK